MLPKGSIGITLKQPCTEDDFEVKAEWHFSATSHGKGACDGLGGTVKRLAARASLQRPYNDQLMIPRQLFVVATYLLLTLSIVAMKIM